MAEVSLIVACNSGERWSRLIFAFFPYLHACRAQLVPARTPLVIWAGRTISSLTRFGPDTAVWRSCRILSTAATAPANSPHFNPIEHEFLPSGCTGSRNRDHFGLHAMSYLGARAARTALNQNVFSESKFHFPNYTFKRRSCSGSIASRPALLACRHCATR